MIEWNRSAVKRMDSGSLWVRDGVNTQTIPLNGDQLHSGSLRYPRKTNEVTAILRVGSAQETTVFKAEPSP